jgi:hypothetical protein
MKVNRRCSACFLLHADFSFGIFSDTYDGGDMFLETSLDFHLITRRYTPQSSALNYIFDTQYGSFNGVGLSQGVCL